jgi:hypothetical protein
MSDLQINIALAKAMGWNDLQMDYFGNPMQILVPQRRDILHCWDMGVCRLFDYRNPVIFAAICKHWNLVVNFRDGFASGINGINIVGEWIKPQFIEKAAALVVIELAKRGVK